MRVIVTGADGALGTAAVAALKKSGDRVASLCRGLSEDDHSLGCIVADDLCIQKNAVEAVDRARAWMGGLDAIVHLVGGFQWATIEEASLSQWRFLFSVNVESSVSVTKAVLPHLSAGSAIVFVGAQSAKPSGLGFGPYGAAKAGVARLAEALSAELRSRQIRVNAILPGIVDTPANRSAMPDADRRTWTSPEAIADVISFLVSQQSRAINGALIPVSNGVV